jgi:hypothetical protein
MRCRCCSTCVIEEHTLALRGMYMLQTWGRAARPSVKMKAEMEQSSPGRKRKSAEEGPGMSTSTGRMWVSVCVVLGRKSSASGSCGLLWPRGSSAPGSEKRVGAGEDMAHLIGKSSRPSRRSGRCRWVIVQDPWVASRAGGHVSLALAALMQRRSRVLAWYMLKRIRMLSAMYFRRTT